MSTVISAAELRSVLGVSSALYSDAILTDICDTAEQIIGPMLTQYKTFVIKHSLTSNVAELTTSTPHKFYVGQTVTVAGVGSNFNGSRVVTEIPSDYKFKFARTLADVKEHAVIPSGSAYVNDLTQYDDVSAVESAMLVVAVDVFQARIAPGGSVQGLDFTPGPYKMGRSILNRVIGLLGPYLDVESVVG
jgi:hypothetical protein